MDIEDFNGIRKLENRLLKLIEDFGGKAKLI